MEQALDPPTSPQLWSQEPKIYNNKPSTKQSTKNAIKEDTKDKEIVQNLTLSPTTTTYGNNNNNNINTTKSPQNTTIINAININKNIIAPQSTWLYAGIYFLTLALISIVKYTGL